jgi:hypothetical protein
MRQKRLTLFFLFITSLSYGQYDDFELSKIIFKGVEFSTTKRRIIESFGQGKIIYTNYECGFFSNDQEGGPYYKLVYSDFNYIGSDKENFYLQYVTLGTDGVTKIKYADKELNGRTTKEEFIKIFGKVVKDYFDKNPEDDSILMYSKGSDDGAIFWFQNGRLVKFEYWTPC